MKKLLYLLVFVFAVACTSENSLTIKLENPSDFNRENEIVELDWSMVTKEIKNLNSQDLVIYNEENEQVPYQLISNGKEAIQSIIFLASLDATSSKNYTIKLGKPEEFTPLVTGRLFPERKDDFTWENNLVGYRLYGPALEETGEISNGLDVWAKKTNSLVIEEWYKRDLAGLGSYHEDFGEGLDYFKVGRTLGLGMTAPMINDSVVLGNNFTNAEIIDLGPLRITVKFDYAPYQVGENSVTETRTFTLDAHSFFNKVVSRFESDAEVLTLGTGLFMAGTGNEPKDQGEDFIAYETPTDEKNGTIYTAAINLSGYENIKAIKNHFYGINEYTPGNDYSYYVGAGWSQSGFNSFDDWLEYLRIEKNKLENPLKIKIK